MILEKADGEVLNEENIQDKNFNCQRILPSVSVLIEYWHCSIGQLGSSTPYIWVSVVGLRRHKTSEWFSRIEVSALCCCW